MADKKEVSRLMKLARKILSREACAKLKKLGDEKEEVIRHSIKLKLENELESLKHQANKVKKQGKDVFFIETKLHSLNGKIKLFTATYHRQDFISLNKLLRKIKKEMKNV